ncbi:MAG: CoA pyrophosphatase [Chloroflexi bacterium]|nr:CoA pyrophosphatase [Chloroflexota bacterium]
MADALLQRLRSALLAAGQGPTELDIAPQHDPEGRSLAAGLVLLYPHRPSSLDRLEPHVVLTQRTTAMRRHSGQISLPGGRYDAEDGSLLRTALRETTEELGVRAADVTIWGRLQPEFIVASHYALAPFVAYTPSRPGFVPAPAEVAEVIDLPLRLILDPAACQEEDWDFQGRRRRVGFYLYRQHKIWGATARILHQVAVLLEPSRAEQTPLNGPHQHPSRPLVPGEVWPASVLPPTP